VHQLATLHPYLPTPLYRTITSWQCRSIKHMLNTCQWSFVILAWRCALTTAEIGAVERQSRVHKLPKRISHQRMYKTDSKHLPMKFCDFGMALCAQYSWARHGRATVARPHSYQSAYHIKEWSGECPAARNSCRSLLVYFVYMLYLSTQCLTYDRSH
jgi:hypothetical protein